MGPRRVGVPLLPVGVPRLPVLLACGLGFGVHPVQAAALSPSASTAPGMVVVALYEREFNESVAYKPELRRNPHGLDLAALASQYAAAGLAILRKITDGCRASADDVVQELRQMLAAMSAVFRVRAHGLLGRLCNSRAPAPLAALLAAVRSRAALESAVTPDCRMLAARLEELPSMSCRAMLDAGLFCATSLSQEAQRVMLSPYWAVPPRFWRRGPDSRWVYREDRGKTRSETLGFLLDGLAGGDVQRELLAAEVGVWHAELSVELLVRFPTLRLLLVDPYHLRPRGEVGNQGYDSEALDIAAARTQQFRERATFIVQTSVDAAGWVAPATLDLVFVDGDHSYEGARDDIKAWWPALRPGGVLAGHDYTLTWPGVVKAANDFAEGEGLGVTFTPEVWWMHKPALLEPSMAATAGLGQGVPISATNPIDDTCVRQAL